MLAQTKQKRKEKGAEGWLRNKMLMVILHAILSVPFNKHQAQTPVYMHIIRIADVVGDKSNISRKRI
jgi:hypothetical protein